MEDLIYIIYNFIIYSLIGWLIENFYSVFKTKGIQKDGFLVGPFKPMYGIAMTLLVIYNEYLNLNNYVIITLCLIIPTLVEYLSGVFLKEIYNRTYWDYSDSRYNYKGIVTLKISFYWMILSYIGISYVSPLLNTVFYDKFKFWQFGIPIVFTIIIFDIILTSTDLFNKRIFS